LDTLNFSLTCFLFDLNSIWQSKQSVVLTELNLSVRCAAGDESSLMTYVFEMARTQRRRLSCALYRSCKYAVELSWLNDQRNDLYKTRYLKVLP